jgi:hypothetical protein
MRDAALAEDLDNARMLSITQLGGAPCRPGCLLKS